MDLASGALAPCLTLPSERGPLLVPATGRPQALFFFKVSCPTCPTAAPAVERLRTAYPALEVVAVSQDDAASSKAWLARHSLEVPLAIEGESHPASRAFGLLAVPTLVLVGADGRIAAVEEGYSRAGYDALSQAAARMVGAPAVPIAPADGPPFKPG